MLQVLKPALKSVVFAERAVKFAERLICPKAMAAAMLNRFDKKYFFMAMLYFGC